MEDKVEIGGGNLKAYKTLKARRIQELRQQVGTGETGEQTKTLMDGANLVDILRLHHFSQPRVSHSYWRSYN